MPHQAPHISFRGTVSSEQQLRLGYLGCGSHGFRNILPCFQFLPVDLQACCDLDAEKAAVFARQFGAHRHYNDLGQMLESEELDAVCMITGYDQRGRPLYPELARQCLEAGVNVWIEKPPAAECTDLRALQELAQQCGLTVSVGFKKMFMPANQKAKALMDDQEEPVHQMLLQYPQHVPTEEACARYRNGERVPVVVSFLDHLCHPMSALQLFMGDTMRCRLERNDVGAGSLQCWNASGVMAHIALTAGQSVNGGMERSTLIGHAYHIIVDNNLRVSLHRNPPLGYGNNPDFYKGGPEQSSCFWEPEFSLGQLYNKGLSLIGYYHELADFVEAVLEQRPLRHAGLDDALAVTAVFEALISNPFGSLVEVSATPGSV